MFVDCRSLHNKGVDVGNTDEQSNFSTREQLCIFDLIEISSFAVVYRRPQKFAQKFGRAESEKLFDDFDASKLTSFLIATGNAGTKPLSIIAWSAISVRSSDFARDDLPAMEY